MTKPAIGEARNSAAPATSSAVPYRLSGTLPSTSLRRISGCKDEHFTNQAEKLTGRLVAELNYSALEDIKTVGMHQYMDEIQVKLNAVGEAIFQTYLFSPPLTVPEPEPEAKPEPAAKKPPTQSQKQEKAASAV